MDAEIKKAVLKFVKERINTSLFSEEKSTLYQGLKILNLSLTQYVNLQFKSFENTDFESETMPEVDILQLPNTPLLKKLDKLNLTPAQEKTMDSFGAVQMTLIFINFEYFRTHDEKEFALEYAKNTVKTIGKAITRITTKPPEYLEQFITNMSREVAILEEELNSKINVELSTNEHLARIAESLHYLKIKKHSDLPKSRIQKTVHQIHFEDFSGKEFERLVFAYVLREKAWETVEWLGQGGNDGGRDIWGVSNNTSYCYMCANFRNLTITKAKSDIDKIVKHNTIPNHLILVCGGTASAELRKKIEIYANTKGIDNCQTWTDVEFQERLHYNAPKLIERFCNGIEFPDAIDDLAKLSTDNIVQTDERILSLIEECLDRPALTTPFGQESSIPNFGKAIEGIIELLNTGVHRLRDGTVIQTIPSRHKIKDETIKSELGIITQNFVQLRDNFNDLIRKKEIRPCDCKNENCSTYMLSPKACEIMDESRQKIFNQFKKIKPDFKIKLN